MACSKRSDPTVTQLPAGGSGGAASALPGADAGGRLSMGQAGEERMAVDAGFEAGVGGQELSEPLALPAGCPTIQALPVVGQQWAVVAVNFREREVIFQNVSGVEQTLTTEHQWCLPPIYQRVIAFDLSEPENLQTQVFQPGDIIRAPLADSDLRTDLIEVDPSAGEMALYPAAGTYTDSDEIMAYVSWGTGQPLGVITRVEIAEAAGLWSLGDHVPVVPGHVGIVAIGETHVSEGYVSVTANCYPR